MVRPSPNKRGSFYFLMKPIKPHEQPIALPLYILIDEIIGDAQFAGVSPFTADIIETVVKNKHTCHVQRTDRDGETLTYPRLWRLDAWRQDIESWRLSKLRADRERDLRFVFEENCKRVARAICREANLEGDIANVLAYRKMKNIDKCHKFLTETWGVKLATTIDDIWLNTQTINQT